MSPSCATIGKTQDVVVEPVLFVPHATRSHLIHGVCDPKEVVAKLDGHGFEEGVVGRQLDANLEHVLAEQCHPRGAVSLFEMATSGQLCASIKHADIVESKKSAFKQILSKAILAVHPPTEIQQQFLKRLLEKFQIAFALQSLLRPVQEDRRPGIWHY